MRTGQLIWRTTVVLGLLLALVFLGPGALDALSPALGAVVNQSLSSQSVETFFAWTNAHSFTLLIVPLFVIELLRYAKKRLLSLDLLGDVLANGLTMGAFVMIEWGLGLLFANALYTWVYTHVAITHWDITPFTVFAAILLADFAYYWDHRFMHRVGLGWATHTVHHSSPYFNMSVAYRFGPLDAVFPLLFSLPIVALGFHPLLVLAAEAFVQVFQTALHTETIGKLPRPIEAVFNTPSHHRVHHGSNRQYWDVNYAGVLIIWDRMFGICARRGDRGVRRVRAHRVGEPVRGVLPWPHAAVGEGQNRGFHVASRASARAAARVATTAAAAGAVNALGHLSRSRLAWSGERANGHMRAAVGDSALKIGAQKCRFARQWPLNAPG